MMSGAFSLTALAVSIGMVRVSLTKKERLDLEQKNFENTNNLIALHDTAYEAYAAALRAYSSSPEPSLDHFFEISRTGNIYFDRMCQMCSAILSDKIDNQARDKYLLAKVHGAHENLKDHYDTLDEIAHRKKIEWTGKLKRSNYAAIYDVVERYPHRDPEN